MKKRSAVVLSAVMAVAAVPAFAQNYPVRPVRLIVTVPPGGAADLVARVMAQKLGDALGQTFVVDNRAGGGGQIAADTVAKAAPDGYTTLLASITTHGIGPHIYAKLPYDPVKDFAPVCLYATMPMIVVANAQLPVKNVPELIALAKAKPNSISFASSGSGGAPHLVGELFKNVTGAQIQHVPYKGSAPGAADVAGGQVQLMFDAIAPHLPHLKSGRTKVLAAISPARLPIAPDAPTMTELGFGKVAASIWYGMLVPAGTPKALIAKLNAESNKALALSDVKERLSGAGIDTAGGSPDDYAKFIRDELAKWGPVVKASGAKLD
ncbi:MAG: tripartite tricarboxylate transporter substrate binding protein [Betaproteobacteria bacterium]|nr:tripartite tricarboxylate transporter substrate binding protein [Betaproteobacteria bacterium]